MGKWEMVKLGDVVTLVNGRAYKQDELLKEGKFPVLRVGNFFSNRGWYYSDLELDENKYCDKGDLLYAWSASFGPKIWDGPKVIYHYHIWKIILGKRVRRGYFFHLLKNSTQKIIDQGHGIAMTHATKGGMEQMSIPLPPLETQKQISKTLDTASELLAMRKLQLSDLDNLIKSIFYDMFGDPVTNEKGWEVKPLGEMCDIVRGGSPRPIEKFLGGDIPWIKIGDATNGDDIYLNETKEHIISEGIKKSRFIPAGSMIFANCGVSLGFARIITFDGCIHDGWLAFNNISEEFEKMFLLKQLNEKTEFYRRTAPSGTQPNLNKDIMKNSDMILPPLPLQTQFSQIVTKIEEQKALVKKAIEETQVLFDSLMSEYFE